MYTNQSFFVQLYALDVNNNSVRVPVYTAGQAGLESVAANFTLWPQRAAGSRSSTRT